MTIDELREEILNLIDFSCGKSLRETHGLKKLEVADGIVDVQIYLFEDESESKNKTKNALVRLVKLNLGYKGIRYKFIPACNKNTIYDSQCKFFLIASGKGGVGKSNVTANLAYALTRLGKKVGIVDADIYGASIPNVLGLPHIQARGDEEGRIIPFEAYDMQMVSTDFFIEDNRPLMWRGPMLGKMLNHFFNDTLWNPNLDYLLVDLPPGTGDVAIDLGQYVPDAKMLVVTTPHPSAAHIAIKAGLGAREMKMDVVGVIENMSFFVNPANKNHECIFGNGGGKAVSEGLDVPLLAQIPLGQPKTALFTGEEEIGKVYDELAKKVVAL